MVKKIIIIPTLNEEKNVTILYKKIKKNLKKFHVLFIDDNSQDKTRSQIYLSKKKYKEIYLIKRGSKLGIGSAHKCGLKWGYLKKYKTIVTMDCDGTHHPKYITRMLNTLKNRGYVEFNETSDQYFLSYKLLFFVIFKTDNFFFNLSFLSIIIRSGL